ncbi:metal-sulfur cluster assembly factor [Bacillus benzoevorans]|uniref:Metal-sulfur cluster biosynthetic enzyme n=1 Tax=Bacillus benzoevorans TaxID=1456 RepID=A0A7X0LX68_9BACI|nr:metal-sulfur cluster assembly factor [Bacillus benzoevorans]MBB6446114.1 metal-sulfur cluster biosynthetic enzyme [Bacillus benzoevorans]
MDLKEKVLEALKDVYDPELNINVVDLGLVYNIDFPEEGAVSVTMTLTTPGCPLHDSIVSGVKTRLEEVEGIQNADVHLVWEPAWSPENMTQDGRAQLGR